MAGLHVGWVKDRMRRNMFPAFPVPEINKKVKET